MQSRGRQIDRIACTALLLASGATAQTTTRASVSSAAIEANSYSRFASISDDGRYVVFQSYATNLVVGDTNLKADIFIHDQLSGVTERISVSTAGVQANGDSYDPVVSADGRFVAFWSYASNLVPGDTNGFSDVFVRDRQNLTTVRASVALGGGDADSASDGPSLSADGRYLAFQSSATNLILGDTNGTNDIFVRDLLNGTTVRASVDSGGNEADFRSVKPQISAAGRFVVFQSYADNLVPGDTNFTMDVFVRDLQTGTTIRASVDSNGVESSGNSGEGAISTDGRLVAFTCDADDLVPGDSNISPDVFVHDLLTGTTRLVSMSSAGVEGNSTSGGFPASGRNLALSAGGRFVVFPSLADNLVPADNNGIPDIFVRDLLLDRTERVSVSTGGAEGNDESEYPAISADGRFVAFDSYATNLVPGDGNATYDVFCRDRGDASAFVAFCAGDGSAGACPCGNSGAVGHGCENSAGTGGASLTASGSASLSADSVQLTCSGELPTAPSIVLQGSAVVGPIPFGDGLRCAGGLLKRMYVKSAVGGVVHAPQTGDLSLSARSAALGDPLSLGATRILQVYYRDPSTAFCPSPAGNAFNVSNAIAIAWGL